MHVRDPALRLAAKGAEHRPMSLVRGVLCAPGRAMACAAPAEMSVPLRWVLLVGITVEAYVVKCSWTARRRSSSSESPWLMDLHPAIETAQLDAFDRRQDSRRQSVPRADRRSAP